MENSPIDITDPAMDEEVPDRRVTLTLAPDLSGVQITEYIGNSLQEVTLSGNELARAYANWWAEAYPDRLAEAEQNAALDKQAV